MTKTPMQAHHKAATDFVATVIDGVVEWAEMGWWPSEWEEQDRNDVIFWKGNGEHDRDSHVVTDAACAR